MVTQINLDQSLLTDDFGFQHGGIHIMEKQRLDWLELDVNCFTVTYTQSSFFYSKW